MINYEEALKIVDQDERIRWGTPYLLADDSPPRPSEDGDVHGLDFHLGEGAMVTLLPAGVFVLRVSQRSRQARLRLNEFMEELAWISERGDRWMFFVENGERNWPDFQDGMAFRVEDGQIVYPKEWNEGRTLTEQAAADYAQWYSEKRGT